jgi:hypothetical protein
MNQDFLVFTVSHFSFGWVQDAVTSFQRVCPELPLLVVDNNPSIHDDQYRRKSYMRNWAGRSSTWQAKFCEAERSWLASQPNILTIQAPECLTHGEAIDLANRWAAQKLIRTLVLIDADTELNGRQWLSNLLEPLGDMWLTAGGKLASGILHLMPSAWLVREGVKHSFVTRKKTFEDYAHPTYQALVDPTKYDNYTDKKWDTGQHFWFECAKLQRALHVRNPDLAHYYMGSRRLHAKTMLML